MPKTKPITNAELQKKLAAAEAVIAAQKEQIDNQPQPSESTEQLTETNQTVPTNNKTQTTSEKETMSNDNNNSPSLEQQIAQILAGHKTKLEEVQQVLETDVKPRLLTLDNLVAELEIQRTEIEAERTALATEREERMKIFSKDNLKVAAVVVGAIILVAGVAYVIRRVMANGDVEAEAVGVETATPDLHVANY